MQLIQLGGVYNVHPPDLTDVFYEVNLPEGLRGVKFTVDADREDRDIAMTVAKVDKIEDFYEQWWAFGEYPDQITQIGLDYPWGGKYFIKLRNAIDGTSGKFSVTPVFEEEIIADEIYENLNNEIIIDLQEQIANLENLDVNVKVDVTKDISSALEIVQTSIDAAIGGVTGFINDGMYQVSESLNSVEDVILNSATSILGNIQNSLTNISDSIGNSIYSGLNTVTNALGNIDRGFRDYFNNVIDVIDKTLSIAFANLRNLLNDTLDRFADRIVRGFVSIFFDIED